MLKFWILLLFCVSQVSFAGTLSFRPERANRSDGSIVATPATKIALFSAGTQIPELKGQMGLLLRDVDKHLCIVPQSALPGVDLFQLGVQAANGNVDIVCTANVDYELPAASFSPVMATSADITSWSK